MVVIFDKKINMKPAQFIDKLFNRDYANYDGVTPIQVYLLRIVFVLTFIFIGMFSWTTIVNFQGEWSPVDAVAFCMWAGWATVGCMSSAAACKKSVR